MSTQLWLKCSFIKASYLTTHFIRTLSVFRYSDLQEENMPLHPSLEGIGAPWVCAQESRQHPVSLDTKPNKMTGGILNMYGSFLSSST